MQVMKHQMEALEWLVMESGARTASADEPVRHRRPKLSQLSNHDEFLTTFERMRAVLIVERGRWSYMLMPQLTGKAQKAFTAMGDDVIGNYVALNAAILKWYVVNVSPTTKRRTVGRHRIAPRVGDPCMGAHTAVAAGVQNPAGSRGSSRDGATSQCYVRGYSSMGVQTQDQDQRSSRRAHGRSQASKEEQKAGGGVEKGEAAGAFTKVLLLRTAGKSVPVLSKGLMPWGM